MERFTSYIIRHPGDDSPAICSKCGIDKPPSEYYRHSVRSDGAVRYRGICGQCRSKGGRTHWSRPVHSAIIEAQKQTCRFCNTEKPLSEFYSNGCFSDGVKKYRTRCIECVLKLGKITQPKIYKTKAEKRSSSPKNFISGILNHAAKRKQHLGFDLDLVYLVRLYESQGGKCAISGVEMTYLAGNGKVNTNISIDRIDSSKGYTRDNVQFVCDMVNRMKSNMSLSELRWWCERIIGIKDEKV